MKNADYANRGKPLEDLINYANQQYLAKGVALVQKIPTPWTVVIRRGMRISAFPAQKSYRCDWAPARIYERVSSLFKYCRNTIAIYTFSPHVQLVKSF